MNVYTRREEMRWTVVSAGVLVVSMAVAVAMLVTAKGKLVPDSEARAAAKAAESNAAQARPCVVAADRLKTEIDVFKANAKAARLATSAEPDTGAPRRGPTKSDPKEKQPDADLAWAAAQPAYKQAKVLVECRRLIEQAVGVREDVVPAWEAVAKAAALTPPSDSDKVARLAAAQLLLAALDNAPVGALLQAARDAEAALKTQASSLREHAQTAMKTEALPEGLLGRGTAMSLGVGLSLAALVLSVISVRAAALRRMVALVPLRDASRTSLPGMHAAEILRLAAQHNGGEPGLVMGAALGGAAAATLSVDPDVFVAGVMGGLLLGLGMQWGMRGAYGLSWWRNRAKELGEIEKPTIPIVLVLNGINAGLEAQFLRFFNSLAAFDAAAAVERLASQAEERILAAAEAGSHPFTPPPAPAAGQPAIPPGYAPPMGPQGGMPMMQGGFGQAAPPGYAPPPPPPSGPGMGGGGQPGGGGFPG